MKELITTSEAAKRLNINERHVRTLIDDGKILAQRVGRAYLVIAESLSGWTRSETRGRPRKEQVIPKPKRRKTKK